MCHNTSVFHRASVVLFFLALPGGLACTDFFFFSVFFPLRLRLSRPYPYSLSCPPPLCVSCRRFILVDP